MKSTFKLLGIIVLAVVVGFAFFACDDGDDNKDKDKDKDKKDVKFPDSCSPLMPQGSEDRPDGNWLIDKDKGYLIFDSGGKYLGGMVKIGDGSYDGTKTYDLESVSADGKTIKVIYTEIISATKVNKKPMTVCTGWTVTGKNLVITGGTDDFAELNDKTLTLASDGEDEGEEGDPLHAEWYAEAAFTTLVFTFKADGKVQYSTMAAATYKYTVADGKITAQTDFTNIAMGSAKYVIDGKKMTLTEAEGTLFDTYGDGDYYKK
jgi:hypothetical protein